LAKIAGSSPVWVGSDETIFAFLKLYFYLLVVEIPGLEIFNDLAAAPFAKRMWCCAEVQYLLENRIANR
jgi:hypothetical protein